MRGAILGSGVAHTMLLGMLFLVRYSVSTIVPGPEIVQVALVDPAATLQTTPPEPTRTPEPKPADVRPVEDTGVKLPPARERRKPRKPEPEPAPRREPLSSPAPALPAATVGLAGLRGDLAVDTGDFEFTYYLILVRNKIAANWTPPAGSMTSGRPVRSVVYFRVSRAGALSGIRLTTSSGIDFFDRSALRAVTISDPLPPLPLGFAGGELGVHFGFEWESP